MTSPDRRRLPDRRRCVTTELVVGSQAIIATIGFLADGRPAELFLDAHKPGSALSALLGDAAGSSRLRWDRRLVGVWPPLRRA
jgi:hypothetical protein